MIVPHIDRAEKNHMRAQLETMAELENETKKHLESYAQQEWHSEYQKIWQDLLSHKEEDIKLLSRYMMVKCNR